MGAPCEVDHEIDTVDLEGLVAAPDLDCPQDIENLVTGEWATKGFLAHGDTGENVLFATTAAGETEPYFAIASGIECVTLPCPIWALYSTDGKSVGYAARLDLSFLLLSPEETAALHDKLFRYGGTILGYLADATWKSGPGPTLLGARVLPTR